MAVRLLPAGTDSILRNIITPFLVLVMVGVSIVISETPNRISVLVLWLSKYTLYIYLFHTCFSGTMRIILRRFGIENCWLQTIVGIIVGLVGPILLAKFMRKSPVLRLWIEPLDVIKDIRNKGK